MDHNRRPVAQDTSRRPSNEPSWTETWLGARLGVRAAPSPISMGEQPSGSAQLGCSNLAPPVGRPCETLAKMKHCVSQAARSRPCAYRQHPPVRLRGRAAPLGGAGHFYWPRAARGLASGGGGAGGAACSRAAQSQAVKVWPSPETSPARPPGRRRQPCVPMVNNTPQPLFVPPSQLAALEPARRPT